MAESFRARAAEPMPGPLCEPSGTRSFARNDRKSKTSVEEMLRTKSRSTSLIGTSSSGVLTGSALRISFTKRRNIRMSR